MTLTTLGLDVGVFALYIITIIIIIIIVSFLTTPPGPPPLPGKQCQAASEQALVVPDLSSCTQYQQAYQSVPS